MDFLEKDLEDIVFNSSCDALQERGLYVPDKKRYRQLKIGNYGIADLVTFQRPYFETDLPMENHHSRPIITVYEFKKDEINYGTFDQALKYACGIKRYWEHRFKKNNHVFIDSDMCYFVDPEIKIKLIGRKVVSTGFVTFIEHIFPNVEIHTYDYTFDGIYFNHVCNTFKNHGF